MKRSLSFAIIIGLACGSVLAAPLGLPPVPIPADNPQTPAKIKLGDRLYHDKRLSADGKVACATCHAEDKGFTDNLPVAKGFRGQTGTRSAPTVINAAYYTSQFWDGREPDLEGQSKGPFINPVEGGLENHDVLLKKVRADKQYNKAFKKVFGVSGEGITIDHVAKAIASFERTIIGGDSAFDRYQYGGDDSALSASAKRGLELFRNKARCVSCHTIEQTQALFTDNRFHNIGVGFKKIQGKEARTAAAFIKKKHRTNMNLSDLDVAVLTDANISELGRFAVTGNMTEVGAFKTPTLRNIDLTAPYMHDGSLETLEDVIDFYNNGGRVKETDPVSGFLSGGIKPLGLSKQEKKDLVAFLKSLTTPKYAKLAGKQE